MMCRRQVALDIMRRVGPRDLLEEAAAALPDPIDLDRDQALLERFGLSLSQLYESMGASGA